MPGLLAMHAAGWSPADPITLKSSLEIAESVLLDRPDPTAPVSNLYLFGRKQDLAFEREIGSSADRRHHVRARNPSRSRSLGSGPVRAAAAPSATPADRKPVETSAPA